MSEIGGGHMHRPENQQCGVLKYARYILKKYWELVIYGVVGVCTTVVNVVVFQILSENGLALFWSNAAAFVISVLFAYVANSLAVFMRRFLFVPFSSSGGCGLSVLQLTWGDCLR